MSLVLLAFTPESPRWLAYNGHLQEAHEVVAITHSDGDLDAPETMVQYQEIIDAIKWEKECGETLSIVQMFRTRSARKRILLVLSGAMFTTLTGKS
jgi:hypothetical protein